MHGVGVYLPLFHLLVARDRLCILGVQIIVWDEYRERVRSERLQSELGLQDKGHLGTGQSGIVRRHCLVVRLEVAGLNSHVRLEPASSEPAEVYSICDNSFGKDADRTPILVGLFNQLLPLSNLIHSLVQLLFRKAPVQVE